ncbi:MAG: hypothetical protein M1839_004337 [Geoglossum umbratile]|nr:MAG: hypothetical protein M1839_004337 [Geoglossum umbratile]
MSVTDTYSLALTARRKLSAEASRPNHDLRIMVGHAKIIDVLRAHLRDTSEGLSSVRTAAAAEEGLATEVVVARELEVDDDVRDDASDHRYGGGTGDSDDSWRTCYNEYSGDEDDDDEDEDKEDYEDEAEDEESRGYDKAYKDEDCEIPTYHWLASLTLLAAKQGTPLGPNTFR